MLKKQLSTLASSLLIASQTQAIPFNPGDNMVLALSNPGIGTYWIDTGFSADQVVRGTGFQIDISAASAALGGTIEDFALLGRTSTTRTTAYNYDSFSYVDPAAGLVFAQTVPAPRQDQFQLDFWEHHLQGLLDTTTFGFNSSGSPGDLYSRPHYLVGLEVGFINPIEAALPFASLTGVTARLFHQFHTTSGLLTQQFEQNLLDDSYCTTGEGADIYEDYETCYEFISYLGTDQPILFDDNLFVVQGFQGTTVPIPGASWLFMSALAGLTVVSNRVN